MLSSAWILVGSALVSASCASTVDTSLLEKQHTQILQMRAPRYAGAGGTQDVMRFIKTEFADWVGRRREATDRLLGNYQRAMSETKDGTELAALHADVAELEFDFAREFAEAGVPLVVAVGGESVADAAGSVMTSAASDRFDAATRAADACIETAQADAGRTRERCSKIKADVAELRGRWKGHPVPPGFEAERIERRDDE